MIVNTFTKRIKTISGIIFISLYIIMRTFFIFPDILYFLPLPHFYKDYFGSSTYYELIHLCSRKDKKTVQPVLEQIENALSYIDTNEICDCEEKFGKLSRYCWCKNSYPEIASEKHKLKFVNADIKGNNGYIWIRYEQTALKDGNKLYAGSGDGLARIEIQKTDGKWNVINIKEPP